MMPGFDFLKSKALRYYQKVETDNICNVAVHKNHGWPI